MNETTLDFDSTSRFADGAGVELHYHVAGDGPPLVMLHGGGPGAPGWSNFKQNLQTLSEDFTVILVDQPGFGRSEKPKEYDVPFWRFSARSVCGLLDTLGLDKVSFVGNSLGGGTTLQFALDYPDRADRLVLMGPGGGAFNIFSTDPTEGIKLLMGWNAPPGPSKEKLEAFLRIMVYDQSLITESLIEERYAAATIPENLEGQFAALVSMASDPKGSQLWRRFDEISHPTLLTWGRDDRVLPLDGSFMALKMIPDVRLHVFSRCGHWAQLEQQAEFDAQVRIFLGAE
jgi:pimeloyl-ACP methyl ester carboxylesterase